MLMGNGCAITSTNEKVTRSSTVIKSISFDKTAEKGDRVNSSTLNYACSQVYLKTVLIFIVVCVG